MSPGRLEAFSDGVFAIAITLLVLDIHVPDPSTTADLAQQLGSQWPSYVAYGVSFLTIGIIWINHHAMLRRIKAIDHEILILNLLLLLCVGLLPFTTALMAAYLKESEGETLAAAIYAGSFLLMSVILRVSNHRRFARYTGLCAGIMVALFITVEAPLSGMSMNPARTLGSALFARDWTALWLYFLAPPAGMLAAAELYLRQRGRGAVFCAKLHHQNRKRCIFCEARRQAAPAETFSGAAALQPPMTRSHSFPHTPGE